MDPYDFSCNDDVWYLAYGSNMDDVVLIGRRKIQPIESKPVHVPGWWLSFDIAGMAFVEPCFASILKQQPERFQEKEYAQLVHDHCKYGTEFEWNPENPMASYPPTLQGVAHRITRSDWRRVVETEGGWGWDVPTGYDRIEVDCTTMGAEAQPLKALVLIARPLSIRPKCQASARYLGLLKKGSKDYGLELSYQHYLANLVPYECSGMRPKVGRFLHLLAGSPIMLSFGLVFWLRSRQSPTKQLEAEAAAKAKGQVVVHKRPSYWIAWYFDKASRFSRGMHDYLVAPIWGSGHHSTLAGQKAVRERMRKNAKEREAIQNSEPRAVQEMEKMLETAAE